MDEHLQNEDSTVSWAWVNDFLQFVQTPRKPVSIEVKILGFQFLEKARSDLKQFKRNQRSGDYEYATFWLQQATEKATKGFLLIFGAIQPDDLRRVSHDTPLAFLRFIESEQLTWLEDWLDWLVTSIGDGIIQLSFDVVEAKNTIKKDRHQLALMEPNQVEVLIQLAQSFKSKLPDMTVKWALYKSEVNGGTRRRENLVAKGNTREDAKFAIALMRLYILGLITYPHDNTTRYPDSHLAQIDYTDKLGVVTHGDTLGSMLVSLIRELERYV